MSNWVEDISYIGRFEIDKRFIKQIGFFVFKQLRIVRYNWEEDYTVYSSTYREYQDETNQADVYDHLVEKLTASELHVRYSEFNVLNNSHSINKVVKYD